VPVEIRHRIFEPFYTSKPLGVGTGIGLSYSYGVVESHGGTITLEDPAQGGACFIVVLPVHRSMEPAPGTADKPPQSRPRSILVVDDEPEIAEMLSEILSREGHRVALAGSGNDALKRVKDEDYDVILSDLKMPDLDGAGLYRRLRASHPHLLERMVFVTGDTLGLNSGHVRDLADCPLIEKPFVPNEVMQAVNRILTRPLPIKDS
jgi:CheY-like chemotaxis protein